MSFATAPFPAVPVADTLGTIPWWEPILIAAAAAAIVLYAAGGEAQQAEKSGASRAAARETRDIDRTLTTHANGLLSLLAFLATAFVTAAKVGSLSDGVTLATLAALVITSSLATWALALVGQPMLISGLHEEARAKRATDEIARVHRRGRLLRVATWCGFPTVALTVIAGAIAVLEKTS